jgi:exopolysaccharide biosynthesis polyprenyl glycosylphosphotransferase
MSRPTQPSTMPPGLPPRATSGRPTLRLQFVSPGPRRRSNTDYLLSADLFTTALVREFKRADRFDESFALLAITVNSDKGEAAWSDVIRVLTAAKSDTDIVGWFEDGAALGLIRPLVHLEPAEAAASLATTVQRELSRIFSREVADSCSLRLEVYSERSHASVPVFLHERTRGQKVKQALGDAAKRGLDITGSIALLMLLGPLMLVISALVKLTSKGPVLFRQLRVGQHGRPFTMFKFRTMQVDADPAIHQQYMTQFIQAGAAAQPATANAFKIVNDPRVTRVGHFLRRSSLDELPQFLNVLRGEMSLVGPRPPLPYEVARYKRWHRKRLHAAKPGITGLWQVTGRSRTTFDEMVRLDIKYARSYSLWTDLKILLATPRAVVTGKGAH